jgi:nucleoside-diphosphate-sugar epimerase
MNSALTYALYFLVCKYLGTEAKMPTNQAYWEGTDDLSDSRLIADITIWASTTAKAANQAFNVTNGDYLCWRYMWPRLARYFGAQASSNQKFTKPRPAEGELQLDLSLAEWAADKREVWDRICDDSGCPEAKATWDSGTWAFQDWVFQRTWSATLSVNKARALGWNGHIDSYKSLTDAFEKFVELKQIPPLQAQPM